MFALFTRIKDFWHIIVGVLVSIVATLLYVLGRKDGSYTEKVKRMEDTVRTEHSRAEFYKDIGVATHEAQANRPLDRDSVVERLRKHGL